jgi:hypothetical protein
MIRALAIAFTLCAVWAGIVARGETPGIRALTGSALRAGNDVAPAIGPLTGVRWELPAALRLHPDR